MKDWRKQRHLLQASVVERKTSEHVKSKAMLDMFEEILWCLAGLARNEKPASNRGTARRSAACAESSLFVPSHLCGEVGNFPSSEIFGWVGAAVYCAPSCVLVPQSALVPSISAAPLRSMDFFPAVLSVTIDSVHTEYTRSKSTQMEPSLASNLPS